MEKIYVQLTHGEYQGKVGYFYEEEVINAMRVFRVVRVYVDGKSFKISRNYIEEV